MHRSKLLYVNSPKYDLTTALHIEGLNKLENVELRFTTLGNYAPANKVLKKKEAIEYGNEEADIIIMGSRPYVDEDIFRSVKVRDVIRVKMEGGDESALSATALEFFRYHHIFKRELYQSKPELRFLLTGVFPRHIGLWGDLYAHPWMPFPFYHSMGSMRTLRTIPKNLLWLAARDRVHAFPFGIEERFQAQFNSDPDFELSCMLRPHLKGRADVIDIVLRKKHPRTFIGMISAKQRDVNWMIERGACRPDMIGEGGIGFAQNMEYYSQIRNSRACISVPGGGFDTLRFWEILGMGSLLISKRVPLQMPHPLIDGIHYKAFDTREEFEQVIDWLYANPEEADQIRRQGHEHALKYHSSRARAEYFMDIAGCKLR